MSNKCISQNVLMEREKTPSLGRWGVTIAPTWNRRIYETKIILWLFFFL